MCNCRKELNEKVSELLQTDGQIVNFDLISIPLLRKILKNIK